MAARKIDEFYPRSQVQLGNEWNKCHSEQSEESRIFNKFRSFTSFRMTIKFDFERACKPYHLSLAGDKAVIWLSTRKIWRYFLKNSINDGKRGFAPLTTLRQYRYIFMSY
ncbi:MAG: hypothetical protein A2Y80_09635 [Deltaproteobacteria bacterium RBG_13_58_19]|nr:MAG: hypothetical protein A2Y80_09635 [Deltaproteobacteria bacterium RBG_13_58_19]